MITIIGNGPVGLICERICQLKKWPYRLIGQKQPSTIEKLILLTHRNIKFLKKIDLLPIIAKQYDSLFISSYLSPMSSHIHAKQYQQDSLCSAIWYQDLKNSLGAYSHPIYTDIQKGTIDKVITLHSNQKTITSDFLIGCDGQKSISARIAHITHQYRKPYHCMVIPCHIGGAPLIQQHYRQFVMAAIPGNEGSIILSSLHPLDSICIDKASLQKYLGSRLSLKTVGSPILYTLTPSIADTCYRNNTLLLGNAALTIEPISAQGLNHAIHTLEKIYNLHHFSDIKNIAPELHDTNKRLFNTMAHITNPSFSQKIIQSIGLCSQLISPICSDFLFHFGNQYE